MAPFYIPVPDEIRPSLPTSGNLTYILNEGADNGIVEVFNVGPLDALRQKEIKVKATMAWQ